LRFLLQPTGQRIYERYVRRSKRVDEEDLHMMLQNPPRDVFTDNMWKYANVAVDKVTLKKVLLRIQNKIQIQNKKQRR